MTAFFKELGEQIQKILDGNLTFYHYLFLAIGVAGVIFSIVQFKRGFFKGLFTLIPALFYAITLCISANGYATGISLGVFAGLSVILNMLFWGIVSRMKATEFGISMECYLLILVFMLPVGFICEATEAPDLLVAQIFVLIFSLLLGIICHVVKVTHNPRGDYDHVGDDPYKELGPGWGVLRSFRN